MHVLGQVLRQLQGKGWLTASAASAASAVNPLLSAPLRSEGVACASSLVSKPSIVFGRRQQKLQKWISTTTTTGENDDDEDGKELEEVDLASVQDQVEQMQEQMDEHLEEQEVDEAVRASSLPEVFDDPTDIPFKGNSKNCLLQLSNLPKAVWPSSVRQFLSDGGVNSVGDLKVRLDPSRLEAKEWYATIPLSEVSSAMRKLRGQMLGLSTVSVELVSEDPPEDLETVLPEGGEYVSLTNIPAEATWQDVKDFFRGYNIAANGIEELKLRQKEGGRRGGGAKINNGNNNFNDNSEETKKYLVRFTSSVEAYLAIQW
eukprot:CAMPEP_0197478150 /NCGR_PEP_ID=MMETSP1309-20131121/23771_1 /TAXON_ID=464262 /ORGANISM="Genus nov. species nov., Strain RCC998" /LENGTH=315 /DNA_ID=CAMNT_0043019427 /DNA_START=159 /DNA_END=1103 /DNA_ORIENTATION=-